MSKFCEFCDNLLVANFFNDKLTFKCTLCHVSYNATNEDTVRKERIKESNIMLFEKIINKSLNDPATSKDFVDCINEKCKGKIVKLVRIGDNMLLYKICTTCGTTWLHK